MVEVTEEAAGAIMEGMVMATAMAITEDTLTGVDMVIMVDMDMVGGVILTGGAILIGEVIHTGGVTLIGGAALIITPTTPLTTMRESHCPHKRLYPRQNWVDSNLPIGTSVRIQRVITPTLRIARVVG